MSKIVEIKDATVGYDSEVILRNISIEISENDYIGVIGPNGGGKTTFLKLLIGQLKPFSGSVNYYVKNDETLFGYLPQVSDIDKRFPITVADVVLSGLVSKKWNIISKNKEFAREIMKSAGIEHLANASIGQLSGGQLQRMFLCRALISKPKLLILDEPSTHVDNRFERDLYELLHELNKTMAIIMVSHDVGTITSHVKTIACINRNLHYHPSNKITQEQLAAYDCPIQIISHGRIPHTVLSEHHNHEH